jgi:hypothetical protein
VPAQWPLVRAARTRRRGSKIALHQVINEEFEGEAKLVVVEELLDLPLLPS